MTMLLNVEALCKYKEISARILVFMMLIYKIFNKFCMKM
jgi:hypothetical protein